MQKRADISLLFLTLLVVLDAFVWYRIVYASDVLTPELVFLNVGQGDAELLRLPNTVAVMTDAGPDASVVRELEKNIPRERPYIDLALISHPQLDHFNGYSFVLDHYTVGAFIINGRADTVTVTEWPLLIQKIKAKHIPLITLGAGDSIESGATKIVLLSPDATFVQSGELNDTGFVEYVHTPDWNGLLTADIGANIEAYLDKQGLSLKAAILKVAHHGSAYSSSAEFLKNVHPLVAVIEVGKNNHYGHPSPDTVNRLRAAHAHVYRTDLNGTVKVFSAGNMLHVIAEHSP